jgi:hypothetical protein
LDFGTSIASESLVIVYLKSKDLFIKGSLLSQKFSVPCGNKWLAEFFSAMFKTVALTG